MKTVSKINEDLYKLLELGKINKIIRHYKISIMIMTILFFIKSQDLI